MSADVHLTAGRATPKARKLSYDSVDYDGYYGADETWDGWEEKWEEPGYNSYDASTMGYYDGHWEEGTSGWDTIDVDMYSMVFSLDASLEPQDLYEGFDFDDKSFFFVLEADDIVEQSPQAWKSRPLKIHPEPAPRKPGQTASGSAGAGSAVGTPADGELGTPTGSPTRGPQMSPRLSPLVPGGAANATTPIKADEPLGSPKSATPGGTATSPKIVISNSQLEHLKQKMQALKQKQSLAPAQEKPEDKTTEDIMQRNAPPAVSNCALKHGLKVFRTPDHGWWCSKCKQEHPKGSSFYGCRTCDYDECERCALSAAPLPKKAPAAAVPAVAPQRKEPSAPVDASDNSPSPSPSPVEDGSEGSSSASPAPAQEKVRRRRRTSGGKEKEDHKKEKSRRSGAGEAKGATRREAKVSYSRSKSKAAAAAAAAAAAKAAEDDESRGEGGGASSEEEPASPPERSSGGPRRKVEIASRRTVKDNRLVPAQEKRNNDKAQRQGATVTKKRAPERQVAQSRRVTRKEPDSSSAEENGSASEEPPPPKRRAASRTAPAHDSESEKPAPRGAQLKRASSTGSSRAPPVARAVRDAAREAAREASNSVDEADGLRRAAGGVAAAAAASAALSAGARGRGNSGGQDLLRRVLRANNDRKAPGVSLFRGMAASAGLVKGGGEDEDEPPARTAAPAVVHRSGGGAALLKPPTSAGVAPAGGAGGNGAPPRLRKTGLADFARNQLERKSRRV